MDEQILRALRMAKLALEDTHGLWARRCSPSAEHPSPHSRLDNSVIIKEVSLAIGEAERERIADTFSTAVAAGKEILDRLVAVLRADKETLEELDARLDSAAAEKRLRGFAEALCPSKPLCSMVYIKQEEEKGSIGCLQDAKFVVSGPCDIYEKQYSCGRHLMQTIEEMMVKKEGVCHVEAV